MSNSRSMNMEPPPASSFRTPSGLWTDDELFSITIIDAIGTAYVKNERTQKKINVLKRNWKKYISEPNVTDGRILFKKKLFVPDVYKLKFRFIKKFHDDPIVGRPDKTKTYGIFNRLLLASDIKWRQTFRQKLLWLQKRPKIVAINTTEPWNFYPSQINDGFTFWSILSLIYL